MEMDWCTLLYNVSVVYSGWFSTSGLILKQYKVRVSGISLGGPGSSTGGFSCLNSPVNSS